MGQAYNPEAKGGGLGVAVLFIGIAAWEKFGQETITNWYRREADKHPLMLAGLIGGAAVTAAHLHGGVIKEQLDPYVLADKHLFHRDTQ